MSTVKWKLEDDLCRCCHSEGSFKNLAGAHNFGNEEEIYFDMLRETLDINMAPVPGMLCAPTYTICDACICRLRDASNFKKQVLDCEEKFKEMYRKNAISVVQPGYRVEVKQEPIEGETADFKSDVDMDEEDDDSSKQDDGNADDSILNVEIIKEEIPTRPKRSPPKPKPKPKQKKPAKKVAASKKIATETEKQGQKVEKGKAPVKTDYYTVEMVDGSPRYSCNTCQRTFKNVPCVKQHFQHVHLKMRPKLRSCYLCEVKVPQHLRSAHLEQAHGIPAPSCGACGKKFSYPNQVLRHQKNYHMGEKTYSCQHCDMMFTSQANLGQHVIKHSAERMHKCEYCGKAFKWRKNLRTHISMHLDERRHLCSICNEGFVQQTSLKYHITKKHPDTV